MTAIEMVQDAIVELEGRRNSSRALAFDSSRSLPSNYNYGIADGLDFAIAKLTGILDYLKLQEAGK